MDNKNRRPSANTTSNFPADQEDDESDTMLYQMERKYFCQDDGEEYRARGKSEEEPSYIIDMFGHSPCKAAHERMLELLVLDNLGISRIGCTTRLSMLAKKVVELDLSCNRLDWPSVGQLFDALPKLCTLNLSLNSPLSQKLTETLPKAPKLRTLILNGLGMPLWNLRILFQSVPGLRELHLSRTKFHDLDSSVHSQSKPISTSLDGLHLNDCGLDKWCQVLTMLRLFPRLKSLYLAGNFLSTVEWDCRDCGNESAEFTAHLRSLSLSNCGIGSWQSIENLEAIGNGQLEELRIAHIPLLEEYSMEERTHLVIGRLRSLKSLNGSTIDARQREDSERFFIRFYANSEKKPLIYDQLVAEHGMLEELVKVDMTPKKYAKVAIHCEEADWVRMWIRLRLTGTVQGLMKFAEGLTKIPSRLMRIFYVDMNVGPPFWPTELRFPNQQLKMLHIDDGDEFFVQSKLVVAAAARQQQQRSQQQEEERVGEGDGTKGAQNG